MDDIFFVFAGANYYPSGGIYDLVYQSDNIIECWNYLATKKYDWYTITNSRLEILGTNF